MRVNPRLVERYEKLFGWLGIISGWLIALWAGSGYFQYANANNSGSIFWDLGALLVAAVFLGFGTFIIQKRRQGVLDALFFMGVSVTLFTGFLSGIEDAAGASLFMTSMSWMPFITLLFHIRWIGRSPGRFEKVILGIFLTIAGVYTLIFACFSIETLRAFEVFSPLSRLARANLVVALISAVVFLGVQYSRDSSRLRRSQIRLILLGVIVSFFPFLMMSLMPWVIRLKYQAFTYTFPFFLFIPLTYLYTIFRAQLLRYEEKITYGLSVFIVTLAAGFGVVFLSLSLVKWVPEWDGLFWPWVISITLFALVVVIFRLDHKMEIAIQRMIYGVRQTTNQVVVQLIEELSKVSSEDQLVRLLVEDLVIGFSLSNAALLIRREDALELVGLGGIAAMSDAKFKLPLSDELLLELSRRDELSNMPDLIGLIRRSIVKPADDILLGVFNEGLWMPLMSGSDLQGVLLLGPRLRNDLIIPAERHSLILLGRQAGIAIHQLRLLSEVRAGREELSRAHLKLLESIEEERRRIARDIHDGVIQDLITVNFQIQTLRGMLGRQENGETIAHELDKVRKEVLDANTQLRQTIKEIHPAGLELFGFSKYLEDYLLQIRAQLTDGPAIEYHIEPDDEQLPTEASISLFRVAQEAMRNALIHANANLIQVTAGFAGGVASLSVQDDGVGFNVPERISQMTTEHHFGLLNMQERMEGLGGRLVIQSTPSGGTLVKAELPIHLFKKVKLS